MDFVEIEFEGVIQQITVFSKKKKNHTFLEYQIRSYYVFVFFPLFSDTHKFNPYPQTFRLKGEHLSNFEAVAYHKVSILWTLTGPS